MGGDEYRGGNGPLNVSRGISGNLLHEVFIEAATQAGHQRTNDVNGYQQEGFGNAKYYENNEQPSKRISVFLVNQFHGINF